MKVDSFGRSPGRAADAGAPTTSPSAPAGNLAWRDEHGKPSDGTREGDYIGDSNLPWPIKERVDWQARALAAEALADESIPDRLDRLWDTMADAEPADLVQFLEVIANAKRACDDVRKQVETKLAATLGTGSHLVDSCEVRVSKGSPSYRQWDNEALVRAVLDSRLVDDEGTVADESPADKLRHCFNLSGSNVRRDALRARKLEPEDYCLVERAPKISVIR